MKLKSPERRRFVRIEIPLKMLIDVNGTNLEVQTRDISPVGIRFQIKEKLDTSGHKTIRLFVPILEQSINITARIVWQAKVSLDDNAPFDVGVEIIDICEENKTVFLKYLCDLLYGSTYKFRI
jgi:c-di-GMP-binding flagellar brake protein YcgR